MSACVSITLAWTGNGAHWLGKLHMMRILHQVNKAQDSNTVQVEVCFKKRDSTIQKVINVDSNSGTISTSTNRQLLNDVFNNWNCKLAIQVVRDEEKIYTKKTFNQNLAK